MPRLGRTLGIRCSGKMMWGARKRWTITRMSKWTCMFTTLVTAAFLFHMTTRALYSRRLHSFLSEETVPHMQIQITTKANYVMPDIFNTSRPSKAFLPPTNTTESKSETTKPSSDFVESSNAASDIYNRLPGLPITVLAGTNRPHKGYFTIGIPSVYRPTTGAVYLINTLHSIIRATTDKEREVTTIVILLSDFNVTFNAAMAEIVRRDFRQSCEDGFIQVVQLSPEVYPDLDHVKQTFKDDRARLKWRAKQNIDFAYLMLYSQNISTYYLQLEDDLITASGAFKDIDSFINSQGSKPWFLLEFSRLGFIGKLFKSTDLQIAGKFLLENYDIAPCDLLLGTLRSKYQDQPIHSSAALFQHVGKFSSLKYKLMPALDMFFKERHNTSVIIDEIPEGFYPPVEIDTSLETYEDNVPLRAFDGNMSTFFWGKTPKTGSTFTLKFKSPLNLSRLLVFSGHPVTYGDRMSVGLLEAATLTRNTSEVNCSTFSTIVELIDGQADTLATGSEIPPNITCLQIRFTRSSRSWHILREIVLVEKNK